MTVWLPGKARLGEPFAKDTPGVVALAWRLARGRAGRRASASRPAKSLKNRRKAHS